MDIFTDQPELPIDSLENCNFVGLKVIARNRNNKEIPFLERKEDGKFCIILNFDPLTDFPKIPSSFAADPKLRHIKLEIEYILTEIEITECPVGKRNNPIVQQKYSSQEIQGLIQPEFYLTLPLGWRISGDCEGDAIKLKCNIERDLPSSGISLVQSQSRNTINLDLDEPYIKINSENKRVYNYLINDRSFNNLKGKIQENDRINFVLSYKSKLCNEIVGVSLFRYFLGIIAIIILSVTALHFLNIVPFFFDSNFGIAFLIVLMGFSYYYGNLTYLGYEIPHKVRFIWIFLLCLIAIFIILALPVVVPSFSVKYIINITQLK